MVKVVVFIIHWCNKWLISCLSDQSCKYITLTQKPWYTCSLCHSFSLIFHFVETYHHRCHFPAAVRFHPSHGIRLRWWNCSPLQEPPPLWAAEWCLPMTPTTTGFRTPNQAECTIYQWRGERRMHRRAHGDVIHIHTQQKGAVSLSTSWIVNSAETAELWIHD